MSLSSNKSNCGYNRASQKLITFNQVLDENTYDPNEWQENSCESYKCEYCNPQVSRIYHNRVIYMLYQLRVISAKVAEDYSFEYYY